MYIYNVTVNVDENVQEQWMDWMKTVFIPEMLDTQLFIKARILRVMVEEELGGVTYSVQYYTKDKQTLERYYEKHQQAFRNKEIQKFADKFVSFATELELLSEY